MLALAIYRTHKSKREEGGAKFTFAKTLFTLGKFMIDLVLIAIGLNANLKKLLANGFGTILLGL